MVWMERSGENILGDKPHWEWMMATVPEAVSRSPSLRCVSFKGI